MWPLWVFNMIQQNAINWTEVWGTSWSTLEVRPPMTMVEGAPLSQLLYRYHHHHHHCHHCHHSHQVSLSYYKDNGQSWKMSEISRVGYISSKLLAGWDKKFWKPCKFAKSYIFWNMCTTIIRLYVQTKIDDICFLKQILFIQYFSNQRWNCHNIRTFLGMTFVLILSQFCESHIQA